MPTGDFQARPMTKRDVLRALGGDSYAQRLDAAEQLAEARAIIADLVQLDAESSGRVAPEDCRFMALDCDRGEHHATCPIVQAQAWLARTA